MPDPVHHGEQLDVGGLVDADGQRLDAFAEVGTTVQARTAEQPPILLRTSTGSRTRPLFVLAAVKY